jgi:hypothetical protein
MTVLCRKQVYGNWKIDHGRPGYAACMKPLGHTGEHDPNYDPNEITFTPVNDPKPGGPPADLRTMDEVMREADRIESQWNRPEHYGGEENPFEPIKIIEHYDLNFNLGNAIKYVLRAPFKGTAMTDLKKAYTYIGFEIRKREREAGIEKIEMRHAGYLACPHGWINWALCPYECGAEKRSS